MKHRVVGGLLAALLLSATSARADIEQKQRAYDAKIAAELGAVSQEAASAFADANAARERGDLEGALRGYARARALAPTSSHPLRRLCWAEGAVGQRVEALGHCREAVAMDPSAANLGALANTLLLPQSSTQPPPQEDRAEAMRLSQRAAKLDPDDFFAHLTMCQAALSLDDVPSLRRGVERMSALAPEHMMTHYFVAIVSAIDAKWAEADAALERAAAAGLPPQEVARMRVLLAEAQPFYARWWPAVRAALLGWAGTLALLALSGWLLSHAAVRAAARLPADKSGRAQGVDALLRRAYRVVLWVSCAFYYVSIPLVLASVLGVGGGIIVAFFAIGTIPIKLVAVVGVLTLVTLFAVIKSLFVRVKDEDPGVRLDLAEHPRLRELLREVADRVGTRPVDTVFLTPGTDVAVYERGSVGKRLRGAETERCLILGAGVLEGMRLVELKSVLAHEYGHFQNDDTAGGGFALAVRRSMLASAIAMAQGGVAAWYNPAWWFVRGFFALFLRISHGASRLQEVLADRWAAFSYGSAAFEGGLRHVIERTVHFDAHAQATLREVVEGRRALANLYAYRPAEPPAAEDIDRAVAEALEAKASAYDSHPRPADRIALVRALTIDVPSSDDADAWSIFEDRSAIERLMTGRVRDQIAEDHGVVLAESEAEEDKVRSAEA